MIDFKTLVSVLILMVFSAFVGAALAGKGPAPAIAKTAIVRPGVKSPIRPYASLMIGQCRTAVVGVITYTNGSYELATFLDESAELAAFDRVRINLIPEERQTNFLLPCPLPS